MKFFTYILYSVYIVIIIGMALLFFAPTIPGVGTVDIKIVKSGSMEPTIMTGGIVLVNEAKQYVEGDVITFASTDSSIPTTHRIVGTEVVGGKTMFVTKGDANEERDAELVAKEDILGKVNFSVPFAGFVLDFARQPLGFMLLVGVPALLIIVDEITNIWREVRRMRRSKLGVNTVAPLVIAPYKPRSTESDKIVQSETETKTETESKYIESQNVSRQQLMRSMDIRPISKNESVLPVKKELEEKTKTSEVRTYFDIKPKLTVATLILALVGVATNLPFIGSTISFSADVESSIENKLTADTLDFVVSPATSSIGFVGGLAEVSGGVDVMISPSLETVSDLVYKVSAEYVSGNNALCENVLLEAGSPLVYSGDLMALAGENIDFTTLWNLDFSLAENLIFPVDNTCVADIVFEGWTDLLDEVGGYVDIETLRVTFTAEVFSPASNLNPLTNFSLDASIEEVDTEDLEVEVENTEEGGGNTLPTEEDIVIENDENIEEKVESEVEQEVVSEEVDSSASEENVIEEVLEEEKTETLANQEEKKGEEKQKEEVQEVVKEEVEEENEDESEENEEEVEEESDTDQSTEGEETVE